MLLLLQQNLGFAWGAVLPVTVPDVDDPGTSQAAAVAAIEGVGLVANILTAYSSTVPAGEVISQSPAPGSSVAPGSTVTITVSLGEAPVQEGGGGPDPLKRRQAEYEWELLAARMLLRREKERLEAAKREIKAEAKETTPDVADVAEIKAESAERQEDLRSLERIVKLHAAPPVTLAPKGRSAYIQASRQADAAAMETLLREVEAQQREEEEFFGEAVRLLLSLQ
jgi:hypothetical protein